MLEAQIPGTSTTVTQHPKDDLGRGAKVKQENGDVKTGEQAFVEGSSEAKRLKSKGVDEMNRHVEEAQE